MVDPMLNLLTTQPPLMTNQTTHQMMFGKKKSVTYSNILSQQSVHTNTTRAAFLKSLQQGCELLIISVGPFLIYHPVIVASIS